MSSPQEREVFADFGQDIRLAPTQKVTAEQLIYRAEDVIYESSRPLNVKDKDGNLVKESQAQTIERIVNKYINEEEDVELSKVAQLIIAATTAQELNTLPDSHLSQAVKQGRRRVGAMFNHSLGSVLEELGDRVPFTEIADWLGQHTGDPRWAINTVNGVAGELGLHDVLRAARVNGSLGNVRLEQGSVDQDITGADLLVYVPNRKGFEEILAIDVKTYRDPIQEEQDIIDMDVNKDTGTPRRWRAVPTKVEHGRVVEEQDCHRVKLVVPTAAVLQQANGRFTIDPMVCSWPTAAVANEVSELANRTANSHRGAPKVRHHKK